MTYNRSLNKKASKKHTKKIFISLITLLLIITLFLTNNIGVKEAEATSIKEKYYISIEVQDGDTLWDLATVYGNSYEDRSVFINEVISANNLRSENITAGGYLVIPVYR